MNYHILTLFPEMVMGGLKNSIIGRAMEKELITAEAVNIRDYSADRHHHVDDYPYGGGAGMVMQPGPVVEAYEALSARIGKRPRVIYMTPQGRVFTQKIAEELAREEELVFLCGHYEGIDERALELIVTDYLSVGDYVLTGGELPAMVMIDCISRLVPGVLNNDESAEFESFHDNLLEYPQYTRPEEFRGKRVPEVLLKGDHKKIEAWRREQSIRRTMERRPELMEGADLYLRLGKAQRFPRRSAFLLCENRSSGLQWVQIFVTEIFAGRIPASRRTIRLASHRSRRYLPFSFFLRMLSLCSFPKLSAKTSATSGPTS